MTAADDNRLAPEHFAKLDRIARQLDASAMELRDYVAGFADPAANRTLTAAGGAADAACAAALLAAIARDRLPRP